MTRSTAVPERSSSGVDGQIRYCFGQQGCAALPGLRVSVTAINVFNRPPPFVNNAQALIGYDQENADLAGRIVRVKIEYSW